MEQTAGRHEGPALDNVIRIDQTPDAVLAPCRVP